jgi:hypothetical protein
VVGQSVAPAGVRLVSVGELPPAIRASPERGSDGDKSDNERR